MYPILARKGFIMKSIVSLLILFYAALGFSQGVDSTQTNLDKKLVKAIVNEKGEVVFVFHDGREAQVFYGLSGSLNGQIQLQQLENSCEYDLKPANCVVDGFFQNYKIQLQWTKHSNPKKVGQVVEILSGNNSASEPERVEQNVLMTDLTFHKTFQDKPKNFPPYKISCDQTQWMEKAQISEKNVLFSSISSEFMFGNRETDVDENQTLSEIYNAQFDLISTNTYELKKHQYSSALISQVDPFIGNQVVHFVYPEKAKICHVAFSANSSELANRFNEMADSSTEIIDKKILKKMGNYMNSDIYFFLQDLLRAEKENTTGGYQ
jgi:hypothetical protein